jgi:hypothetical protein
MLSIFKTVFLQVQVKLGIGNCDEIAGKDLS